MDGAGQTERGTERREIDGRGASTLLRLSLTGPTRPVDRLIARIEGARGLEWLARALEGAGTPGMADPRRALLHGGATLGELIDLKEGAKARAGHRSDADEHLAGVLVYFLAVGAALLHHGRVISSQAREEVDAALSDLATAMPDEWAEFLARAVLRVPEAPEPKA